jgi:hypothetical protein
LGNLSTPNSVQKLQTALHAKAKAEAGYRFYALYDKIHREDIRRIALRIRLTVEKMLARLDPDRFYPWV